MKTLIIDNYDSMTFNLFQYVGEINEEEPLVVRNDETDWPTIDSLDIDNIIISPGPGRPERKEDFGISRSAILNSRVPVLGVCLGHQGIAHLFGGMVRHAEEPTHGRATLIYHDGDDLFEGIPSPISVVRYHSLIVDPKLPDTLSVQAKTAEGHIMALRCRSRPIWGVQFHPESVCTEYGKQLLLNFRRYTERGKRRSRISVPCSDSTRFNRVPAFKTQSQIAQMGPKKYRVHARKLEGSVDMERLFVAEFGGKANAFWLDSSLVAQGLSRFSFMGDAEGPHAEFVTYHLPERTVAVTRNNSTVVHKMSLFDYLNQQMETRQLEGDANFPFDFVGGYVGYFGYELKQEWCNTTGHISSNPDGLFIFADRLIVFDHLENVLWLVCLAFEDDERCATAWFDRMESKLKNQLPKIPVSCHQKGSPVVFQMSHGRNDYVELIRECIKEIKDGESYEICLTNKIRSRVHLDGLDLYRILRSLNPAPYSAFLNFGGVKIMCSSPERFLKIDRERNLEAKPIKGTIARSKDPKEDVELKRRLESSIKDRAENLMIVDLLRNDLGLVSDLHSVHVPKLMDIESYATVHQMVSTVRGRLNPSVSGVDAVRAAFPGGSMTGSPKLRTMDIIDRLEGEARGVYSGAIGFLGLNGCIDLNIVIRTVISDADGLSIGCGGAITYLSDPIEEFNEMVLKALAPIKAIAQLATGDPECFRLEEGVDHDFLPSESERHSRELGVA